MKSAWNGRRGAGGRKGISLSTTRRDIGKQFEWGSQLNGRFAQETTTCVVRGSKKKPLSKGHIMDFLGEKSSRLKEAARGARVWKEKRKH